MVKTLLPTQGAQFQSLVEDLRSCMPHSVAKKKKFFFFKSEALLLTEVCPIFMGAER